MKNKVKLYILETILIDNAEYVKESKQSAFDYYMIDYENNPESWNCMFTGSAYNECSIEDRRIRMLNFKTALKNELKNIN